MPPVMPPSFDRGQLLGGADRLVDRGGDHVLKQLGVLGVDRVGRDRDLAQRHVAGHRHLDHAAAGAGLDGLVLQLLLRLAPSRPASAGPAASAGSCPVPWPSARLPALRALVGLSSSTTSLRVEFGLQQLDDLIVGHRGRRRAGSAGVGASPPSARNFRRRRAPTIALIESVICSHVAFDSALRLLKLAPGGKPDVERPTLAVDPQRPRALEEGGEHLAAGVADVVDDRGPELVNSATSMSHASPSAASPRSPRRRLRGHRLRRSAAGC